MNKLKSIFIVCYLSLSFVMSLVSVYQLVMANFSFVWLGVLLVNLPIALFISRIMVFSNVARTSAHFPLLSLITVCGILFVIYSYNEISKDKRTSMDTITLIVSLISFTSYFLYNFWYSKLVRASNIKLEHNSMLPLFYVTNTQGNKVTSTDYIGHPTIWLFFRGNWCPLCMAQIKEVVANYQQLNDLGAKVVLISRQSEKHSQALAEKFDVELDFMVDKNGEAAKNLGIDMKNGLPIGMEILGYESDTTLPTVIISDKKGKIIYSDLTDNYRVRPEPKEFIEVLSTL